MRTLVERTPLRGLACSSMLVGALLVVGAGGGIKAGASEPHQAIDVINQSSYNFGQVSEGALSTPMELIVGNASTTDNNTICDVDISGSDPDDFVAAAPQTEFTAGVCPGTAVNPQGKGIVVPPNQEGYIFLGMSPGAPGPRSATAIVADSSDNPPTVTLSGSGSQGYYTATSNGAVHAFGDATPDGDVSSVPLNSPIVGIATTNVNDPNTGAPTEGYWLVAADGGIFNFGAANFLGSTGSLHLNRPIVGMASHNYVVNSQIQQGYWLVASDGGIFNYGGAPFYGSTGSIALNKPIVGMAPTPDGDGYWLVASDGGIFAYGDAQFYGSTGSLHLNKPIVGMAVTPDGRGYWLVAADGGIFAFGDAQFLGSTGSIHLNRPIVGMSPTPDGTGYWFVASDGGIFNEGDGTFNGSTGGGPVSNTVGMASTGAPTTQAEFDNPAVRAHSPQDSEPEARTESLSWLELALHRSLMLVGG